MDVRHVHEALDLFFETLEFNQIDDIKLISGGARGADTLAIEWAISKEINYEVYPAKWKAFGKTAGPKRNMEMLESRIDTLVAFPGGVGTAHMKSICRKNKINVITSEEILNLGILYK